MCCRAALCTRDGGGRRTGGLHCLPARGAAGRKMARPLCGAPVLCGRWYRGLNGRLSGPIESGLGVLTAHLSVWAQRVIRVTAGPSQQPPVWGRHSKRSTWALLSPFHSLSVCLCTFMSLRLVALFPTAACGRQCARQDGLLFHCPSDPFTWNTYKSEFGKIYSQMLFEQCSIA